jgi:hypothetical protein
MRWVSKAPTIETRAAYVRGSDLVVGQRLHVGGTVTGLCCGDGSLLVLTDATRVVVEPDERVRLHLPF